VRPVPASTLASEGSSSEKEKESKYKMLHVLATQSPFSDAKQKDEEELDSPVVKPVDEWNHEEEEEDIRDVLERFEDTFTGEQAGGALGRSRSFEAIKKRLPSNVPSEYYEDEEDDVGYAFSDERTSTESGGERNSTYSRGSFLDPDKSESARERFLQRVADMYGGDGGRGHGQVIPPVPKLPDSLLNKGARTLPSGRTVNRF
jgi:hypothetical protein